MAEPIHSIRYPFSIDGGRRRLAQEEDYPAHVEQLIRQVLFTDPGERVNRPDFGCGLRRMVFAPNSVASANLLQLTVFEALDTWLSSVIEVEAIDVNAIDEFLMVRIVYWIKARGERRYLNLEVTL